MTDEQKRERIERLRGMIECSDHSDEDLEWLMEALKGSNRKCSRCDSWGSWDEISCSKCGEYYAKLTLMSLHWALLQRLTEKVRKLNQLMGI